ncbi:MAG: hypothetical protein IPM27_12080 [Nitrosomonadales bacterium]|nr:hypothetical protein [Nitrosomonadales bacterium]
MPVTDGMPPASVKLSIAAHQAALDVLREDIARARHLAPDLQRQHVTSLARSGIPALTLHPFA